MQPGLSSIECGCMPSVKTMAIFLNHCNVITHVSRSVSAADVIKVH